MAAVRELSDVILTLVRESTRDAFYDKALDCLRVLRAGCIIEAEPAAFNSALRRVRAEFEGGPREEFWRRVASSGMGLLTADDVRLSVCVSLSRCL
jgi:ATP-dependent DNA helicase 2 subunit 2